MRRAALAFAAALGITVVALALPSSPSTGATTAPGAPTKCAAEVVSAGVNLTYVPPTTGLPLKWYAVKVKGTTATPLHTTDGSATSFLWTGAYQPTDTWQLRAVNAVGFSTWCEATIGPVTDPSPTPTPTPTPTPPPTSTRPAIPYSSSAWMKQSIAQLGLTVDTAKTSAMRTYITAHDPHSSPNIQGIGGQGWGDSWGGLATCADPVYKIGTGTVNSRNSFLTSTGFHAPDQMAADINKAITSGQTDLPFTVWDTCGNATFPHGFVVKGTGAHPVAGTHTINVAGYAGAYDDTSNGLDYRAKGSNGPNNWSSRGVIPASAVIRADQVKYGIANDSDLGQRLELFWWETDSSAGMISPPMAGFEGGQAGNGAEGQVLGVDPAFVPSATCSDGAKVVLRNLQTFGAYIGDNAGKAGTSLKAEQDHGQWAGLGLSQRALDACGIKWANFIVYAN